MRKDIYVAIQKKAEQLCKDAGDSIFVSLLLIRQLSQEDASQLYFAESGTTITEDDLWEIVATNQGGNYISSIKSALTLIESRFPFVHKLKARVKDQNVEDDVLKQLIILLSAVAQNNLSCAAIYENYLKKKAPAYYTGGSFGDFYTPRDLAQCLAAFLAPGQGTAYDPCCGSGSLLLSAQMYSGQNLELYGQAQDDDCYLTCQVNLILRGAYIDLGKAPANTLLDDQHKGRSFDYILANPPFNSANWFHGDVPFYDNRWRFGLPPRSNANFAWLQHILSHLNPNGRAAVVLPNGTLTTQTYWEASIRKAIVQRNLIEAIIALPPGLFHSTKVPCCIWLLSNTNRASGEILFIDAAQMRPEIRKNITSEQMEQLKELINKHRQRKLHGCTEWYGIAPLEVIEQNEFLLSPNLYTVISRPRPSGIKEAYGKLTKVIDELSMLPIDEAVLSSISAWRNAEAAKAWTKAALLDIYDVFGGVTKSKAYFGKGFPILDVKTVICSPYVPDSVPSRVQVTDEEKIKYSIKCGDVFLNRTSETAKELACCCVALKNQDAVYSGFIKRLRPRGEQVMDPLYAACYFRSEIYRWEIENVSMVYTTYASVNNNKLSKVSLYFPDTETQKRLGATLFEVFRFREQCPDALQVHLLKEFERLLIQQHITYPVLYIQNKGGDYQCK